MRKAFITACESQMANVVAKDHSSHGILKAGSPTKKAASIPIHFRKSHVESRSSDMFQ